MHVHASFSEGRGSVYAQLSEATKAGMDLVYLSDHDHRKQKRAARSVVHFTSLTNDEPGLLLAGSTGSADIYTRLDIAGRAEPAGKRREGRHQEREALIAPAQRGALAEGVRPLVPGI